MLRSRTHTNYMFAPARTQAPYCARALSADVLGRATPALDTFHDQRLAARRFMLMLHHVHDRGPLPLLPSTHGRVCGLDSGPVLHPAALAR